VGERDGGVGREEVGEKEGEDLEETGVVVLSRGDFKKRAL